MTDAGEPADHTDALQRIHDGATLHPLNDSKNDG